MKQATTGSEARFVEYVESLAQVLGYVDRAGPLKDYCTGLLMPGERKSVEPMAAVVAPSRVSAEHQSLLHFVGQSAWSDEAAAGQGARTRRCRRWRRRRRIEAWIVDDTGFAKKGVHSVGVARQYCGRLGKTDNCQVAVTLSIANHAASLPIAYRLYLPEEWASDAARRQKAHVPDDVKFQTKPEIALDQIRAALAAGVARGVVLADAAYGIDGGFRAGVTAMGLTYAVGVQSTISVWPPGMEPSAAQALERTRTQALARAARRRSSAGLGQDAGDDAAAGGLARRVLARGLQPNPDLALRRRADTARLARLETLDASSARMAADRVARRRGASRPNTGSRPCPKTSRSKFSSIPRNCAGASSATMKNSRANSASPISKGEAGAASIITPRSASPPMDS